MFKRNISSGLLCFCQLAVLAFTVSVEMASADESTYTNDIEQVFQYSGVEAHLNWVYSTVLEESQLAWKECGPEKDHSQMEAALVKILSVDALRLGFMEELDQRMTKQQLDHVVDWTVSEAGINIQKAEADSVNFDDAVFEAKLSTYQKSGAHDEARIIRLKRMLADTGAVYFLSALNTELSALVSMASVCTNDAETIASAEEVIREDRSAEALYRSFMRQGLVLPSGVVYQAISNADIDAMSSFSQTDAGKAYFTALIKGMRSLLASKVDGLKQILVSMHKPD